MDDGASAQAGEVPFVSALINGRGRYQLPDGSWSQANLTVYEVEPGNTYCFRVVATMMEKNMMLSFDQHSAWRTLGKMDMLVCVGWGAYSNVGGALLLCVFACSRVAVAVRHDGACD